MLLASLSAFCDPSSSALSFSCSASDCSSSAVSWLACSSLAWGAASRHAQQAREWRGEGQRGAHMGARAAWAAAPPAAPAQPHTPSTTTGVLGTPPSRHPPSFTPPAPSPPPPAAHLERLCQHRHLLLDLRRGLDLLAQDLQVALQLLLRAVLLLLERLRGGSDGAAQRSTG